MTCLNDEKCTAYLRISLGSEKERLYETGNWWFLSSVPKEVATEVRWSLVFVFDKSPALRYEAFLKNGAVLLGLSTIGPLRLNQWKEKKELVTIADMNLSSRQVFEAFARIAPQEQKTQPAGMCNRWMVTLLEDLGVSVRDRVKEMSKESWNEVDTAKLKKKCKQVVEELDSLLSDKDRNEDVQASPASDKHYVSSWKENQEQRTATNYRVRVVS